MCNLVPTRMLLETIVAQLPGKESLAKLPKRRLELFLRSLANLPVENRAIDHLKQRFAEFLPDFPLDSELAQLMMREAPSAFLGKLFSPEAIAALDQRRLVVSLSMAVRQAWAAPDAETKDWHAFILRRRIMSFFYTEDKWPVEPPPLTPLEQALRYLQMDGRRARRCANSECPAPFFLQSGGIKSSVVMSAPSRRAWKRNDDGGMRKAQRLGKRLVEKHHDLQARKHLLV